MILFKAHLRHNTDSEIPANRGLACQTTDFPQCLNDCKRCFYQKSLPLSKGKMNIYFLNVAIQFNPVLGKLQHARYRAESPCLLQLIFIKLR